MSSSERQRRRWHERAYERIVNSVPDSCRRRSASGGEGMSVSEHQTASGRPLRVAPAWVGAAQPAGEAGHLPVREAVWIWSVRRFARVSLWALPLSAVLYGLSTLGFVTPPGSLLVQFVALWLS